jgi:hypothetical protein
MCFKEIPHEENVYRRGLRYRSIPLRLQNALARANKVGDWSGHLNGLALVNISIKT